MELNEISPLQTAATAFAFSSVFVLLLWTLAWAVVRAGHIVPVLVGVLLPEELVSLVGRALVVPHLNPRRIFALFPFDDNFPTRNMMILNTQVKKPSTSEQDKIIFTGDPHFLCFILLKLNVVLEQNFHTVCKPVLRIRIKIMFPWIRIWIHVGA